MPTPSHAPSPAVRRLVPKPAWVAKVEDAIASRLRIHPNWLSLAKLLVLTPVFLWLLARQAPVGLVVLVFGGFAALDYLDGVVARHHGTQSALGRVLDRVTDYPLVLSVAYMGWGILPRSALALKFGLDLLLLVQFCLGWGTTENRLRTAVHYLTLLSVLLVTLVPGSQPLTTEAVTTLLWLNIVLSLLVVAYNARLLQKRFLADLLSFANLACGGISIYFSSQGRFEISLMFLLLGAGFDGFDGAAARRFGGTRIGVYSDDVADGVNYGIAPGLAIYFALGGVVGALIGIAYAALTLTRLVYFTLAKAVSDPSFFQGAPSTVGGVVTLSSLALFGDSPALVGVMVGAASVLMVSFDTRHRHLGRLVATHSHLVKVGALVALPALVLGWAFWGARGPVALLLTAAATYGLLPIVRSFRRLRPSQPPNLPSTRIAVSGSDTARVASSVRVSRP